MKKIGLVGYFGWGNFGDELFVKAHQEHLGADYNLEILHDKLREPYYVGPIDEYISSCDAIIIGGGDLINPVRVSGLYWREEYLQKPVFVFGIGVPSTKHIRANAIDHYRKFFQHENCKLIVARDIESANWIKHNLNPSCEVLWFADPVCSVKLPEATEVKGKILGVVMRSHRSLDTDLSHVRTMIDHAKKMGYSVKHIVLANLELGKADLELVRSISKHDEEVYFSNSIEDMCRQISTCSLLASIKFHGVVVAAMYGIPSIAMSVTPKNRNFLRMIERPEMLCSYTDKRLYQRIHRYPAPIPRAVIKEMKGSSEAGYHYLKESIDNVLSGLPVQIPGQNPTISSIDNNVSMFDYLKDTPGVMSVDGVVSKVSRAERLANDLPRKLGVTDIKRQKILEIGNKSPAVSLKVSEKLGAVSYVAVDSESAQKDEFYEFNSAGRLSVLDDFGVCNFNSKKFDFIHSYAFINYIEDPSYFIKGLHQNLKAKGRAYLSIILKLGSSGSGLSGYLPDMPWIHLTHTEEEVKTIMLQRHGVDLGLADINDWSPDAYLNAFSKCGFDVIKCWFTKKPPEEGYYEDNKDILGNYSFSDLSKSIMHVTLQKQ